MMKKFLFLLNFLFLIIVLLGCEINYGGAREVQITDIGLRYGYVVSVENSSFRERICKPGCS